ncbi:MAG: hypothetical protein ACK5II_11445 [Paracoccus sp. (in: a-proteobacteria)]
MNTNEISALFSRQGNFLCARWGRPVAPVIFGLADESLNIFRTAIHAAYGHANHPLADTDPETGANLMMFFCRNWEELSGIPDLNQLTGQSDLVTRLNDLDTNHYQIFRFDKDGAIRACLSFVRMAPPLSEVRPAALAETLAVRSMLTFAYEITATRELAELVRAAYDPRLPDTTSDPSHSLRLLARMEEAALRSSNPA